MPKRQAEEVAAKVNQAFEAFYQHRASQGPEPTLDLLVLSEDGKAIVMRKEDLREGTKPAAERASHKLKTRRSVATSGWRRCSASSGRSARPNRSWVWKARRQKADGCLVGRIRLGFLIRGYRWLCRVNRFMSFLLQQSALPHFSDSYQFTKRAIFGYAK